MAASACGSKKDVKIAKRSVYDADFAIIYTAALNATRDLYPTLDDNPGPGVIKTAWHQVSYASNTDDMANQRTIAAGQGVSGGAVTPGQAAVGQPTRLAYKRFFIRFEVAVVGGRPWRVRIVGHASEWEPGNALPTELKGAARPPWLDGRTDALTLAIYKRIKQFAVPMKPDAEPVKPEDSFPKTDPSSFKNLPAAAATHLAQTKDALSRRDYAALRAQLADDITWSLGGAPGADTAMAMWQADTEALDAMARLIGPGCAGTDRRITCPAGEPVAGAWQLVLELRGSAWKITSFLRAE
ncbi:MAG: hypothetical protein M3680_30460 [Myxococcota bacterium]|nr:hypothetical protein [Myxococcota bacterium]